MRIYNCKPVITKTSIEAKMEGNLSELIVVLVNEALAKTRLSQGKFFLSCGAGIMSSSSNAVNLAISIFAFNKREQ